MCCCCCCVWKLNVRMLSARTSTTDERIFKNCTILAWGPHAMRRNNNFECIQIANWDLGHADFKHETFSRSFLSLNNIQHTFIWRCVGVELNLFYMHTQTKQHVSLKCALYISLLRNEREKSSKESSKQHDDSSSTSSSTQQ